MKSFLNLKKESLFCLFKKIKIIQHFKIITIQSSKKYK
jgi:hypothetical protein